MAVYYNEIDKYAAQWLRNLIETGHIAAGDVDERSIKDVRAGDLVGYTQCHFFAGIGAWSYALRLAGWPDDRPVWTGSCPCQPFSAAGKQQGTADERHLWPEWFRLIDERKPPVVFGEQVEAAIRHGWLDLVQADLEGIGYAFAAAGIPAAGFGAPHIRQRLWFVADAELSERRPRDFRSAVDDGQTSGRVEGADRLGERGGAGGLDHHHHPRLEGLGSGHQAESGRDGAVRPATASSESLRLEHGESDGRIERRAESSGRGAAGGCGIGGVADANGGNASTEREQRSGEQRQQPQDGGAFRLADANQVGHHRSGSCGAGRDELAHCGDTDRPGPTNGHWRDADWLHCRDGKWRPVEPGAFPLAHGAAARVGRLRAYGNAIVPQVAAEFIGASMDSMSERKAA